MGTFCIHFNQICLCSTSRTVPPVHMTRKSSSMRGQMYMYQVYHMVYSCGLVVSSSFHSGCLVAAESWAYGNWYYPGKQWRPSSWCCVIGHCGISMCLYSIEDTSMAVFVCKEWGLVWVAPVLSSLGQLNMHSKGLALSVRRRTMVAPPLQVSGWSFVIASLG